MRFTERLADILNQSLELILEDRYRRKSR